MRNLYTGAAAIALLWAGQAAAQETTGTSSPAEANSQREGEIVVTAQRREQRLVDVPATVSTVSSESLERAGVDSLMALNKLVPGVYITQPVYFLSPTIRGVGSTLSVGNESNVAIYVDEVYQPSQASNVFDLASIAGIEVLKGPQGTLFGRNATGGAILVKTLDPSFTAEGKFNLGYERFDVFRANGYLNLPISDKIAANLAVSYKHGGGHIRDNRTGILTNPSETYALRGKVKLQPTDDLEIILTAAHTEFDNPTASNYTSLNGVNALSGISGAGPVAEGPFNLSHNIKDVVKTRADEYTARINLDTGSGTLSSISAIKRDRLDSTNDIDNTYLPIFRVDFTYKQKTFTQELNYTSDPGGDLNYVVGAYYFHNYRYYPTFQYNQVEFLYANTTTDSFAGYADGTFDIGNLAVIAGIRYSTEKRHQNNALLPHPLTPTAAQGSRSIEVRESAWTPRFGLRYALGDRSNVYATYSRGFKSGSFNATSITEPGVVPETVDAFEVGYKTAGDNYQLSAAAYYYNYSKIQANTLVIRNGVALNSVVNAGKGRIYGLELDGYYQFSDALNLRATLGYTNARYTDFKDAPGYQALGGGAYSSSAIDATGNAMVRQPEFQASAQVNYIVPLGDNSLTFTLSPSYNSRVHFDFANQLSQSPVFLLDGSIDLALKNRMKLSVFGRNMTNKQYFNGLGFSTFNITASYAMPVTYGASFSYSF